MEPEGAEEMSYEEMSPSEKQASRELDMRIFLLIIFGSACLVVGIGVGLFLG